MNTGAMRFGVLASTGGAVLGQLLESAWFRRSLALVASDRECGALGRARSAGVATVACVQGEPEQRESQLADAFDQHGVEQVLVFYTRWLRHDLLRRYRGRLWNLHPAPLPAFPGRHGFEDGFRSGAPVLGTTLHAIDESRDGGPIVCQTAFVRPAGIDERTARHAVFCQQVRTALQSCRWLSSGRVCWAGDRVVIRDAPTATSIDGALYSPGLDDPEAASCAIPVFDRMRVAP